MPILVISDIHGNLTALDAVLNAVGNVDAIWCLGDLVGYGPDPVECVERVRNLPGVVCLLGNHDAAVIGKINLTAFNWEAKQSIRWTQRVIDQPTRDYLIGLPEKQVIDHVTLAHGSPRSPIWEYIIDPQVALENFDLLETNRCMVGHTHIPVGFEYDIENDRLTFRMLTHEDYFPIVNRVILNPGSVGQPRDHDPRAAYALYYPELNEWRSFRVEYDIASVQKRFMGTELPDRHAERLTGGW